MQGLFYFRSSRKSETPTTLTFTQSGLLAPASGIEVSLELLEEHFVRAFPGSESRKRLFENFQRYLDRFQDEIFPWFEMWVDGSFVTKKENPKDVDVVVFLDWDVYELRKSRLDRFYSFALENQGIDAYIVSVFPPNHPAFVRTKRAKEIWLERFTMDRESNKKGFLKLSFGKNIDQ